MYIKWVLSSLLGKYQVLSGNQLTYKTIKEEMDEMYGASIDMMTISRMVNNAQPTISIRNLTLLVKYFSEKLGEPIDVGDILAKVDGDEIKPVKRTRKKRKEESTDSTSTVTVSASESLREVQRKKMLESVPVVEIDPIEAARFEAARRTAAEAAEAVLKRRG